MAIPSGWKSTGTGMVDASGLAAADTASALVSGGLYPQPRSVDSWNFAPRYVVPTLMISGKYDSAFPYDTNLKPLFDTLGTAPADKEIKMFDGGHANPVTRPETLGHIVNWFDRYVKL